MTKQKQRTIIWKYRNGEYVATYWRFQTPDGRQAVKELTDEQLKEINKK